MEAVAIITVLAGVQVFWFSWKVGEMRAKHGIKAPATSGHPDFERAFRVHQNTIEQFVITVPALWIFAYYVQPLVAAGFGALFVAGRFIYRASYLRDPGSRATGFIVGALATVVLALGGLVGALLSWI